MQCVHRAARSQGAQSYESCIYVVSMLLFSSRKEKHLMSNASSRSAQAGFEYYIASHETPTREAINLELAARGLDPISARTHDHYRRLERYGFTTYMPINELDVLIKHHRQAS